MLDLYSLLSLMIVLFLLIVLFVGFNIDKQLYSKTKFANKSHETDTVTDSNPSISIIIPITNQISTLKRIIPVLCNQRYSEKFEVIVIHQESVHHISNELDVLKEQYDNLRSIRIPNTLKQISLRKLAITLGIKSARNEWVILLNPETIPDSIDWLKTFGSQLTGDVDMVSAYYNFRYNEYNKSSKQLICERIKDFALKNYALSHNAVLGCNDSNLAIRKKWFLDSEGFSDCLDLPHSELTVLSALKMYPQRMRYVYSPLLLLEDSIPSSKIELKNIKQRKAEAICYLKGNVLKYFLLEYLTSILYSITTVGFLIYFVLYLAYIFKHVISLQDLSLNLILLSEFALFVYLSSHYFRKTLKIIQEKDCIGFSYVYRFLHVVSIFPIFLIYVKNRAMKWFK